MKRTTVLLSSLLAFALLLALPTHADDWPQWMGPQRDGVWREVGIVEKLPNNGPTVLWRTNVNRGYVGPAVVGDRLYMLDRLQGKAPERKPGERALPVIPGNERVLCLNANTGAKIWEYPYDSAYRISLSSFYQGSLLLDLGGAEPTVVWNRRSKRKSEFEDGLHTTMSTPVIRDGHLYGVCGFGELRCLDLATGDRKWETFAATEGKKSMFGQVFIVEQAGRYWLWNDQGELILAKFTPSGYEELSRAKLLPTIEHTRGRDVLWCHPAFANRRAYVHNGQELVCVSLAATNAPPNAVPGA